MVHYPSTSKRRGRPSLVRALVHMRGARSNNDHNAPITSMTLKYYVHKNKTIVNSSGFILCACASYYEKNFSVAVP